MQYSNLTNKSNVFLKRFTHTSRHVKCSDIVASLKYKNFLDFGSGDGQFFEYLKIKPKKNYFAYEPYKQMYTQFIKNNKNFKSVKLLKNKKNLKSNFYDIITVNEVIEHLPNRKIYDVIELIKLISKKNSTIIISVPIEVGFSALVKNFIRFIFSSTHEGLTFTNLIKSIFAKKINRGRRKYYKSHIGFNYYDLKKILSSHFYIQKITYTPFGFLKGFLNSQIFFICKC